VQERWGKKGFWEGEKGSQVTALGSKQAMSVSYFCTLKICTKNVGQKKKISGFKTHSNIKSNYFKGKV